MHNLIFYALFMVYFLCLNTVLMLSVVSIAFVSSYLYFSYLVSFSESTYKTFLAAFEHLIGLNWRDYSTVSSLQMTKEKLTKSPII